MELCFIFLSYFTCLIVNGVFGDEVKSVSVMEGESVTLNTDTVKQKDDLIVWCFGSENTVVARINGEAGSTMLSKDERFSGRLKLNDPTGDLIITNITSQHTGPYKLRISSNNEVSYKNFNVTVYALPVSANNLITKQGQHQDITQLCHKCSESSDQQVNVITAVVVSVLCVIIIISFFIYRRAKANSKKLSEVEDLTKSGEKRSIYSSSTSKEQEASSFLNGKQHWIGAGSV